MGTLAMDASSDLNGNCHLWIIFLWMVAAVALPFADFKIQSREKCIVWKEIPTAANQSLEKK